ncbi:lipopolysaccharide-induced tumor necrosis factor-alpha factor homolog isoform X2 [Lineus longissimus]|uniref:lipopolysaccharide-induced tumor necrosis factor-alpha factor homolog isoform X2 n=1 Tax=Lineus longissimus TaxID=88925 RepID=UPI002B4EE934
MEKEAPPPSYGAVDGQQQPPYPQPGMPYPPAQPGPTGAPPMYEPPKDRAPPGAGYQQPYTQQPQPVHQTIIVNASFGPQPMTTTCPMCNAFVTTTVEYNAGALPWIIAGLLCLFGCWLGCCLIPFCVTDLHDCTHTCPNCNRVLGRYNRM